MKWSNQQERAAFLEAFGGLSEVFGKEFSKFTAKAYFKALSTHDIQPVVKAMESALKRCRFFPKPVELLEFIEGTPEDRKVMAEAQAREVLMAVRRHGIYATVQFADPITNAIIRQYFGGWANVCSTREDAQRWFIKDFSERYAEYKTHGIEDHEPLRGISTGPIVNYVGGTPRPALEGGDRQAVKSFANSLGKRLPRKEDTARGTHAPQ